MIRINLLPIRQARKLEAARRELVLSVAGGLITLFLSMGGWAFFEAQRSSVQADNAALQSEIDRLAADVARVDEMEKFKAELQRKLKVISDLRARKVGPVHMMDELAGATPERLQLMELDERGGEITIDGISVTNEIISQFLRALDASEYFESVYLQNIEAEAPRGDVSVTLKRFKLTARLVTPKAEDPTAPKGAGQPGGGT